MIKNTFDFLYACIYVMMRKIKENRDNLGIASNWYGICLAFNINSLLFTAMILFAKNKLVGLGFLIPFILFPYFTDLYFISLRNAEKMTKNLSDYLNNT
jgi:hypothetical protein